MDKKLESKMEKAFEIRNKYVHDLLMMAIFPINSLLEEDVREIGRLISLAFVESKVELVCYLSFLWEGEIVNIMGTAGIAVV